MINPDDGISEATARELAVNRALTKECDYLFVVDSDVHFDNPDSLRELIMFNRTILAPILTRDKSVWSNFWGAVSEKGFYAMSFVLSLFAAIAVQKNTRDMKASKPSELF